MFVLLLLGEGSGPIDELVSLDNKRKLIQKELDDLRSQRKKN
ncbi:MAG: hypothetical protein CM1200mP8_6000 [Chloroflexota bacterium]|nr:MAG: hypothetical protein CM1200mP8_6000 [Chloroflexota bacterium]